ncbi:hypothetical protein FQN55_004212 [Onygenales sp. PD_40]|nr:hypothetical protein FQN55_004212 [Onygenales sp. PD_40]
MTSRAAPAHVIGRACPPDSRPAALGISGRREPGSTTSSPQPFAARPPIRNIPVALRLHGRRRPPYELFAPRYAGDYQAVALHTPPRPPSIFRPRPALWTLRASTAGQCTVFHLRW